MLKNDQKFSKNRQKGNLGEDIACLFLMKQGFKIIDRNYLKPWGEIDIIAMKRESVHFVEVKSVSCEILNEDVSRETDKMVTRETIRPEENMTEKKLKRLQRAVKTYLIDHRISRETPFCIDLLTVKIDPNSKTAIIERFDNVGM